MNLLILFTLVWVPIEASTAMFMNGLKALKLSPSQLGSPRNSRSPRALPVSLNHRLMRGFTAREGNGYRSQRTPTRLHAHKVSKIVDATPTISKICITLKCGIYLAQCVSDTVCREELHCIQNCNSGDVICQVKCMAMCVLTNIKKQLAIGGSIEQLHD